MSEEKKHNFQIGQVIYLLSEEKGTIIPAIVIEEQIVRKLDGHQVSWKVAVGPPNDKRKEVDSNKLKGELYASLEEIRAVMTQRLNDFIDNLIDSGKKRTEAWYGQYIVEDAKEDGSGGKIDPASLLTSVDSDENDLFLQKNQSSHQQMQHTQQSNASDIYKVKTSPITGPLKNPNWNVNPNDPKSSLKQKLIEITTPSEEEMVDNSSSSEEYVVTDDGRKVPVKFNVNNK